MGGPRTLLLKGSSPIAGSVHPMHTTIQQLAVEVELQGQLEHVVFVAAPMLYFCVI